MSLFNWFRGEESFSNEIKRKGSHSLSKITEAALFRTFILKEALAKAEAFQLSLTLTEVSMVL